MNRLILIGNGFDLAHGLKTSYANFIEWYWEEWGKRLRMSHNRLEEDRLCSFRLNDNYHDWFNTLHFMYGVISPIEHRDGLEIAEFAKQHSELCNFSFKSPFFQKICQDVETKNWVDIEDVYSHFLKSSDKPKKLNDDLEFIKVKLVEYLNSLEKPSINPIIQKQIFAPISKEEIAIESTNAWKETMKIRMGYDKAQWEHLMEGYVSNREIPLYSSKPVEHFKKSYGLDIVSGKADENACPMFRLPDNIMFLNFNYTNTADMYLPKADKFTVNHIHGNLSNSESVIFGYGDERDDEYEVLMKKNDNEYLQHIKSFRYLEASNYRKMLSFIESAPYQVCIMGHSCGLSDRTLLATLFEHRNCVSIKPYYHKKDDGTDNYRELVQNIARNFSNPRLMRDRVVAKQKCQPLGEI